MNDILFRDHIVVVAAVKNHLINVVTDKALTFRNIENNPRNRKLQLGIDPCIFLEGV